MVRSTAPAVINTDMEKGNAPNDRVEVHHDMKNGGDLFSDGNGVTTNHPAIGFAGIFILFITVVASSSVLLGFVISDKYDQNIVHQMPWLKAVGNSHKSNAHMEIDDNEESKPLDIAWTFFSFLGALSLIVLFVYAAHVWYAMRESRYETRSPRNWAYAFFTKEYESYALQVYEDGLHMWMHIFHIVLIPSLVFVGMGILGNRDASAWTLALVLSMVGELSAFILNFEAASDSSNFRRLKMVFLWLVRALCYSTILAIFIAWFVHYPSHQRQSYLWIYFLFLFIGWGLSVIAQMIHYGLFEFFNGTERPFIYDLFCNVVISIVFFVNMWVLLVETSDDPAVPNWKASLL